MRTRRHKSASSLVPGIERYPDLLARFEKERANLRPDCRECDWDSLVSQFSGRVAARERVERYSRRGGS